MADGRTIVDYVERTWDTFQDAPVNEVDSLVFCQLAYLRLGETFRDTVMPQGVALKDLFQAEHRDELYAGMRDEKLNDRLIPALASSPRFRNVRACLYMNDVDPVKEKQFSATCFRLPDGALFVAFRGTDTSLVGWKEDFNLAVQYPVPAQVEALRFLNRCAVFPGSIYLGGHSKGGNLAIYAAMEASDGIRARIKRIYDHDAPGFPHRVAQSPAFKRVSPLVSKTVPQGSVVGLLFESVPDIEVVQSDGVGIMQHDPYTWQVDVPARALVKRGKLDPTAAYGIKTLDEWIAGMSESQRGQFINALFGVLSTDGATDFMEGDNLVTFPSLVKGFAFSDDTVRSAIVDNLGSLLRIATTPQTKAGAPASGSKPAASAAKAAKPVKAAAKAASKIIRVDFPHNEGDE